MVSLSRIKANKRWKKDNPEKNLAATKDWRKRNPEYANHKQREYSYGLTKQQFEDLIKKQKNRCAICRSIFIKTPNVDHCHKTLKVRGLLCVFCNSVLGYAQDKVKVLQASIKYLKGVR